MIGKIDALRNKIIADINSGALPKGSKIPSRNRLALKYDYSRSTVDRALKTLIEDGRLAGHAGSGTYVVGTPYVNELQKLFISIYSPYGNMRSRARDQFFNGKEAPLPFFSFFEEELAIWLSQLTTPGVAMIWDRPSLTSLYGMSILERSGTRQLLVNRNFLDYDAVFTDQRATLRDALAWLLIEGGRDITMLCYRPTPQRSYMYERLVCFYECALEMGGRFLPSSIYCNEFKNVAEETTNIAHMLFVGNNCPKSVMLLHGDFAMPLIKAAAEHGKIPGRDFALLCFDELAELREYEGVCMVKQNYDFMFSEAMRWLKEPVENLEKPFRRSIKGELIYCG